MDFKDKKQYLIVVNARKLLNKDTQCFSLQFSLISLGQFGSVALEERRIQCEHDRNVPDIKSQIKTIIEPKV